MDRATTGVLVLGETAGLPRCAEAGFGVVDAINLQGMLWGCLKQVDTGAHLLCGNGMVLSE